MYNKIISFIASFLFSNLIFQSAFAVSEYGSDVLVDNESINIIFNGLQPQNVIDFSDNKKNNLSNIPIISEERVLTDQETTIFKATFPQSGVAERQTLLATNTPDVVLHANLIPRLDDGNELLYPRTYYKNNSKLYLGAVWKPFFLWGVPTSGHKVIIKYELKSDDNIVYSYKYTDVLDDNSGDSGWCGLYTPYTLPPDLTPQNNVVLRVTMNVSGITLTNSSNKTKLFVYDNNLFDLPISHLYDFSQTSWQWKDDPLGNCQDGTTIGTDGCATASKGFIFNYLTSSHSYSPRSLNNCLKSACQGKCNNSLCGYTLYSGCCSGCPRNDKNLLCAPPDVLWEGYYQYDRARVDEFLESGIPVMFKTTRYGMHYVVAIGKRASGEWNIFDPLDGQIHMMETRGITENMIKNIYFFSQW